MPIHDDDDDLRDGYESSRGGSGWDEEDEWEVDEDPHAKVPAPDDLTTVRCTACKKLIFEDADQCPYCKQWQTEAEPLGKPIWFKATVFFCILALALGSLTAWVVWSFW